MSAMSISLPTNQLTYILMTPKKHVDFRRLKFVLPWKLFTGKRKKNCIRNIH